MKVFRKVMAGALALVMAAGIMAGSPKASMAVETASDAGKVNVVRLGGADRFDTAAKISSEGWSKADTVVIANAYNYADALAGAPLAYALEAPILLTYNEYIPRNITAEISRLGAKKVIILGGPAAVSTEAESILKDAEIEVTRIWGQDRYETADKIAEALRKATGTITEVFIASGVNYPDALSASSAAALKHAPILYSPKSGAITDNTVGFIRTAGINTATILGGESAIGKTAQSKLTGAGVKTVNRIGGEDRYDTSMKIAVKYVDLFDGKAASLATGKNFPDALAGSVLAAKIKMPVLLTDNTKINDSTKYFVSDLAPEKLYVFGGATVISDSIANGYSGYGPTGALSKEQAAAYLSRVESFQAAYGKGKVEKTAGNAVYLKGVSYVRLLDLDGDNSPELICASVNDTPGEESSSLTWSVVYTYKNDTPVLAYGGPISNCGQDFCPAVTLLCDGNKYCLYTTQPDGSYDYFSLKGDSLESVFTVKYDEYGENPSAVVNGKKTTIKDAEKQHKTFLNGKAADETDLFYFGNPGGGLGDDYYGQVILDRTEDTIAALAAACAPDVETPEKAWTREGYFSDENDNMLSVTYMDLDDEKGWYVGFKNGEDLMEDSYGGMLPQVGDTLQGELPSSGSKPAVTVTISEEGEDGLMLVVKGGDTYHFKPMDMPDATIIVTINTEGWGNIAYAEGEDAPEIDPEYPYQSAQINLAEPATHTFAAWPKEGNVFVKWTKNGEDYSTEPMITLLLDESADYVAVFEAGESDGQNPVMSFIGEYQSGRAHARVEADGTDNAIITIDWGGSARSLARWVIKGKFDSDTLTVNYTDCVKSVIVYNDDGELKSETTEYENGTGSVTFGENSTFTWRDDQSDYDELVFKWAPADQN